MSRTIQIRDVDDTTYTVLRTRAAAAHLSLTAYLRNELDRLASGPSMGEWLNNVTARDWGLSHQAIGEVLREIRDEDE
jgi:plasmid stability protein